MQLCIAPYLSSLYCRFELGLFEMHFLTNFSAVICCNVRGSSAAASYHHPASSHTGLAPSDQLIGGWRGGGGGGGGRSKRRVWLPPSIPDGTLLLYRSSVLSGVNEH
jgi:hypothetical protein